MFTTEPVPLLFEPRPILEALDRVVIQPALESIDVERQILNSPATKLDVAMSDVFGDRGSRFTSETQHFVIHVDTDHTTFRPDDLGGDEADLTASASEIEQGLIGTDISRGVSAAIVPLDDFVGNRFEQPTVVIDGTTESLFACARRGAVALARRIFCVEEDRDDLIGCSHGRRVGSRSVGDKRIRIGCGHGQSISPAWEVESRVEDSIF